MLHNFCFIWFQLKSYINYYKDLFLTHFQFTMFLNVLFRNIPTTFLNVQEFLDFNPFLRVQTRPLFYSVRLFVQAWHKIYHHLCYRTCQPIHRSVHRWNIRLKIQVQQCQRSVQIHGTSSQNEINVQSSICCIYEPKDI